MLGVFLITNFMAAPWKSNSRTQDKNVLTFPKELRAMLKCIQTSIDFMKMSNDVKRLQKYLDAEVIISNVKIEIESYQRFGDIITNFSVS